MIHQNCGMKKLVLIQQEDHVFWWVLLGIPLLNLLHEPIHIAKVKKDYPGKRPQTVCVCEVCKQKV